MYARQNRPNPSTYNVPRQRILRDLFKFIDIDTAECIPIFDTAFKNQHAILNGKVSTVVC